MYTKAIETGILVRPIVTLTKNLSRRIINATVNDYRQKLFFLPAFAYNCVAPPCFSPSQNKDFAKKLIDK